MASRSRKAALSASPLVPLLDSGEAETYDFAFVDADKTGYDAYYERLMRLVRPGGLMAFDNDIVRRGILQPGVRFLQKPFSAERLLEVVRTALDAD